MDMWQWMQLMLLLGGLGMSALVPASTPPAHFSDELDTGSYDCQLTLLPKAAPAEVGNVRVLLEWADAHEYTAVTINATTLTISTMDHGASTDRGAVASGVLPGAPYVLTLARRANRLLVLRENAVILQATAPRAAGSAAGIEAGGGWSVTRATIQRLEPVVFSDDFMRTSDDQGAWRILSGHWALQSAWDKIAVGNAHRFDNASFGQNPFAWGGCSAQGQPALCMVGSPNWEDYTLTVAVKPAAGGAVGVQVNMPDAAHGLLVRWSPGNNLRAGGNQLAIYNIQHAQRTLLATDAGGYLPGQWYQLSISSSQEGLSVRVDGRERLHLPPVAPWRGAVALYAEGPAESVFNDVTVYGRALQIEQILESRRSKINKRFQQDRGGMQNWANSRGDWRAFPEAPGYRQYRWPVGGEQRMVLTVKTMKLPAGTLTLLLNGDGRQVTSGYRAVLEQTGAGLARCTLYRDAQTLLSKADVPLPDSLEFSVRFGHSGQRLRLELDDETIAEADDAGPLPGTQAAYAADGAFALAHDVMLLGPQVLDYSFAEAPVDWFSAGTWMESIRWSCSPNWSFLAGWSRGDAALWLKQRIAGDQSLDVFMGLKMEYPREHAPEPQRLRDMGVTLCGDGLHPRSGYSALFAETAPDNPDGPRQLVLLREGVQVASAPAPTFSGDYYGFAHQHWFELELRVQGNTVEFYCEGERTPRLRYVDPQPLAGGVPAIWTSDNGIMIARARLHMVCPPTPRQDPQVVLAQPAYAEFAITGQPLTLDFHDSWSTTGKPITLRVIARHVPDGEDTAIAVSGMKVTFTPKVFGEHWYQILAVDADQQTSVPFDFSLPVFDARQKRDDSHAIVLYRFDEGHGLTVLDHSAIAPPANILIPTAAPAHWLAPNGLSLHGSTPAMTAKGVSKLLALAHGNAFTLELWVSTDTIAPPNDVSGCMMSWEAAAGQQNFSVGQNWYDLFFDAGAQGGIAHGMGGSSTCSASDGARPWLQHLVYAFDGKQMHIYVNGEEKGKGALQGMHPAQWYANAVLLLGNYADGHAPYLGSYYLAAIHSRCFSAVEALHNFHAGPVAR